MKTLADRIEDADQWRSHLIENDDGIAQLLQRTHRVAVLGIKTAETGEPAYYVAAYAQRAGLEIVPIPVYFPAVTEILGRPKDIERPFLLLVVGYPAADAVVPDIVRMPLADIATFLPPE